MLLGSKRGQWVQLTILIVVLLALGLLFLGLQLVSTNVNDMVQDPVNGFSNESATVMQEQHDSQGSVFDSSLVIVLVGVWLLCLALAYQSQGSPLLLVVALFIIVALGFAGMIFSNTWSEISSGSDMSVYAASYPITNFVLTHYLVFILAMGFTTLIMGLSRGGGF